MLGSKAPGGGWRLVRRRSRTSALERRATMARMGARIEPEPGDLSPVVGEATDVVPLGRDQPKPGHELTADEDVDAVAWSQVAEAILAGDGPLDLLRRKLSREPSIRGGK